MIGAEKAKMAEKSAPRGRPMLVSSDHEHRTSTEESMFSKRSVMVAVGRRSLPHLLEATLIPAVLLYVTLVVFSPVIAMTVVLVWTYGAVLRRVVRGNRIPGVLMLATIGLTMRTVVGLLTGSTFMYFIQPVATTVVLSAVFFGSTLIGRPLVARLASDFCPLSADIEDRPGVARLFSGLTLLWAGIHLANAATTFGLLVSLPVATFVALKTGASLAITFGGIVLTVSWAIRIARRENLIFAPAYA
jgi:hypothetical protein